MIMPTVHLLLNRDLVDKPGDSGVIKKCKRKMRDYLKIQYSKEQENLLLKCSFLDPRFKNLGWLTKTDKDRVKQELVKVYFNHFFLFFEILHAKHINFISQKKMT